MLGGWRGVPRELGLLEPGQGVILVLLLGRTKPGWWLGTSWQGIGVSPGWHRAPELHGSWGEAPR